MKSRGFMRSRNSGKAARDISKASLLAERSISPRRFSRPAGEDGAKPRKRKFGVWTLPALRLLARLAFFARRWFDPFRFSPDRKLERDLLRDYEQLWRGRGALTPQNLDLAVELASLPQEIRGFGHVKARYVAKARKRQAVLKKLFDEAAAKEKPSVAATP